MMASSDETPAETALVEEQKKCRRVILTGFGGYNKLHIQESPVPEPEKGEVLLKVRACGLNFTELMLREGFHGSDVKTPCAPGVEVAGVVEKLGEETTGLEVGARVIGLSLKMGAWSDYVSIPINYCFPMPDEMSFEEGAAIPINYLTAYMMLFDLGNLRKGQSVLIHMAAGGVGVAVTQLCKSVGNVTVFGTASEFKHEVIKEVGVTHPIDYRNKDYVEAVRAISPTGVDIALDPLAGGDTKKCFDLLKPLGKLICFGIANAMPSTSKNVMSVAKVWWHGFVFNPSKMMKSNHSVAGFHLKPILDNNIELTKTVMTELFRLFKEGSIKPIIDSVWALEEVGDAMRKMHERKNIGKVILSPLKKPEPKTKEPEAPKTEDTKTEESKDVDTTEEAKTEEPKDEAKEEQKPADEE